MEKHYRFAGIDITVYIPENHAFIDSGVLASFSAKPGIEPHRFEFLPVNELPSCDLPLLSIQQNCRIYGDNNTEARYIGAEHKPYMLAIHRGKTHTIHLNTSAYRFGITAKTVLNSMSPEHLAAQNNGFVFHCSYIEHNGKAILFTAPSRTGKSTQAELWHKYRGAQIINGDRAVVRIENGEILACGIPFAGSSTYCENRTLPLAAVVYLAQAPWTTIRKTRGYEAFSKLWEGISVSTWNKDDVTKVSYVAEQTATRVPVYYLACTPDESAISALEGVL